MTAQRNFWDSPPDIIWREDDTPHNSVAELREQRAEKERMAQERAIVRPEDIAKGRQLEFAKAKASLKVLSVVDASRQIDAVPQSKRDIWLAAEKLGQARKTLLNLYNPPPKSVVEEFTDKE